MKCGIYKIRNAINNKVYIGSSIIIEKRWSIHTKQLNKKIHKNPHLQSAWNKYGQSSFEFSVIEECIEGTLLVREDIWINYYDSTNPLKGYNLCTAERHLPSEGTKQKMRNSHLGKTISNITKQKMRNSHLGNKCYNFGKHLSDVTKQKLKNMNLGEKHPNFGKHRSEETKQKIRESNMGSKNCNFGKHQSEETKQKTRDAFKQNVEDGKINKGTFRSGKEHPNYKKPMSQEQKFKIGEANSGKRRSNETLQKMRVASLEMWAKRKQK